jgi:hypothetical protein
MDAVCAADHRGPPMFHCPCLNRVGQPGKVLKDDIARFAHLQRLGGVNHIGRCHAEVQPAGGGADPLGNGGRKGDDIVLRRLLDLVDAGDVERAESLDIAGRVGGYDAS